MKRLVCVLIILQRSLAKVLKGPEADQLKPEDKDILGEILERLTTSGLSQWLGMSRQSIAAWKSGGGLQEQVPKLAIIHSELFGSNAVENYIALCRHHQLRHEELTAESAIASIERQAQEEPWSERLAVGEFRRAYQEAQTQLKVPNTQLLELVAWMKALNT